MKFSIMLIFLFIITGGYAQDKMSLITGKVNSSGAGILVYLKNTKYRTLTDASGTFVFSVPAGSYVLVAGAGDNPSEVEFMVGEGEVKSLDPINLVYCNLALEEVVVTGQFEPQSLRNSVYRVRTISNERIQMRAATNVETVLNTELGIRFSNDLALGEADIQLMGMSGQHVKVLLDGIPLIDRGANRQSLSQIDINSIDHIEIVEGPMSVVYGTDALAGVINLITKKGNSDELFSVTARVQEETVGKEYRGFVDEGTHNGNLGLIWQKNKWELSASGTRNNFGGWAGDATGRQREWHPKDQWMMNGRAGYRGKNFNTWYRLDYLDERIYSYGPLNINNYRARDQEYVSQRYTHQVQADWQVSDALSMNLSASYQDYKRETYTTILDATTGTRTLSTGDGEQDKSGFDSKFFRGTLYYKLSPKISLQPGMEMNLNSGNGQRIMGNPHINDYAFFISSEIQPFAGVNIRPGLRFTENSVYDAPGIIPSINTKFRLSDRLDLRAAYARGFRAPALRELYFNFFDASHSIQGNENLKAEFSNSLNAYLSWETLPESKLRVNSTLGAFYNRFNNQITTGYLPGNNAMVTYVNIERFRTEGFTFENKLFWSDVQWMLGFSYIGRFNRLSDQEDLPSVMWTPEFNSNLLFSFPQAKANLSIFYKHTGKRPTYEVYNSTAGQEIILTEIAGFNMADITASRVITDNLTLNAGIKNIFNITRITNSSMDTGGAHSAGGPVPMAYGRSFFFGLHLQFSTKNHH